MTSSALHLYDTYAISHPSKVTQLKKQNLRKPIIDCSTRWCSIVVMLKRLSLLKDYCTELAVTKFEKFETLIDAEWAKIEEVCQTLASQNVHRKTSNRTTNSYRLLQ